jgi:hypothetical protein
MFRALLKEQEDLAWAPQPFAVLEMAVVRMATMASGDDVARLLTRLDALERGLRDETGGRGGNGPSGGNPPPARSHAQDEKPRNTTQPRSSSRAANPASAAAAAPVDSAPSADAAAPVTPAELPPSKGSLEAHPAVILDRLRDFLGVNHPGLMAALEGGQLIEHNDQLLRVMIPETFAATRLRGRLELLESEAAKFFKQKIRVEIVTPDDNTDRPSDSKAAPSGEALRELRQRALEHPAVNLAVEILEGEIIEIRPTGAPS